MVVVATWHTHTSKLKRISQTIFTTFLTFSKMFYFHLFIVFFNLSSILLYIFKSIKKMWTFYTCSHCCLFGVSGVFYILQKTQPETTVVVAPSHSTQFFISNHDSTHISLTSLKNTQISFSSIFHNITINPKVFTCSNLYKQFNLDWREYKNSRNIRTNLELFTTYTIQKC